MLESLVFWGMKFSQPFFSLFAFLSIISFLSCDQQAEPDSLPTVAQSDTDTVAVAGPYLEILGVAQDAGYPQSGCRKACCAPAWEHPELRKKVVCLGLVDPVSGEKWLFEATPDFPAQLHQLSPSGKLDGIFLTHGHIGHYTGLMHLGREVMGAQKVPVYAMPRMRSFLSDNGPWSQLVALENIVLQPLAADSVIQLNERLSVTPFLVPHRDEFTETVGFRIQGPDRSAVFIPDIDKWEKWERDIMEVVNENDVVLVDGTFFANGELPGRDMSEIPHPFVEESIGMLKELAPSLRSRVRFIHFNHTNPLLQEGSDAQQQVLDAGFAVAQEGEKLGL